MSDKKTYTREEAIALSTEYFNGDTLAASVFVDKYALRNELGELVEATPTEMHKRLAKEFARVDIKYPNPISEEEYFAAMDKFQRIVPQGSPMNGIGNDYQTTSISNCFVIGSPQDSYGGIMKTDEEQAQLMKRRAGVGLDISHIRPKGVTTKNAAKTTDGIGVFMERFSNTCREVAQNGRRGALMLSISIKHPEIETFIKIKNDKTKVTGANISIRITDDFMKAVKEDVEYEQKWPVDSETPTISKMVKAKDVWEKIIHNAWSMAEPGVLFWDTVHKNGPADIYPNFKSVSTNPCLIYNTEVVIKEDITEKISFEMIGDLAYGTQKTQSAYKIFNGVEWVYNTTFRKTGTQRIYKIFLKGEENPIECTYYHRHNTCHGTLKTNEIEQFLKDGRKIAVKHLPNIVPYNGEYKYEWLDVERVEITDSVEDVFCATILNTESFLIRINDKNILTRNCGEITISEYDSCRLISMNLLSFVKEKYTERACFDFEEFKNYSKIAQRMMDNVIDLELEKIDSILAKIDVDPESEDIKKTERDLWIKIKTACERGRRTGLGITALGDTLAALGVLYGSKESVEVVESLYKALELSAYESSIDMAKDRGSFPIYDYELEKDHPFISRVVSNLSEEYQEKYKQYGRRNIALTTTAPTGSVSIMTQTSSGIEPVFMLSYDRRKKINPSEEGVTVDYVDTMGDKWQVYKVYHHELKKWMDVTGETDITKSPWYGGTANEIDWVTSVDMQAAAQRWVDHSISKTCNLPENVTEQTVADVYMRAWETGCKGFTVYRDKCRDGVLVTSSDPAKKVELFEEKDAPKRPEVMDCDIFQVKISGESWTIFIGLFEGKPFEIFGGLSKYLTLSKKITSGKIQRHPKKKGQTRAVYDLHCGDEKEPTIVKDIVKVFENATQSEFTRILSLALRHGSPLKYVVDQLQKDEESDMYSFSKVIARVLKNYIKDGTKITGKTCPSCGGSNLVYQEKCHTCLDCGFGKCG